MHPRLLAVDGGCSGGTCPAVYDSDPDLPQDELAIVGSLPEVALFNRLSDRIADEGEALVTIKRSIVERALRPEAEAVDPAEFAAQFETFSYSAFRLETLQQYVGTSRDEQWITTLKRNRRWGKTHQRVHVVLEPLTAAMVEELTAGYEGNVSAGEDIRIIPVSDGTAGPGDLPRQDFWLFDSSKLYVMHYGPDGMWVGAQRVRDPQAILDACRARDAALHLATPWHDYIAGHPDLQRRLAQ